MHSCLYEGQVAHRRVSPVTHEFQVRLFMVYLDLAELPGLLTGGGPISRRRFAAAAFDRADHLKQSSGTLDDAVRYLVEDRTGVRPRGPVRLLTQLRYCGFYFSPLNLFYCFDSAGERVETVVAEVSNTPWGEQHCYVLWEGNRAAPDAGLRFQHDKAFHVSPFMGMDIDYRWRLSTPGESLRVHVANSRRGERFFHARLALTRRPLTRPQLTRSMICFPLMTTQIVAAIYYQALRLWMKKCPFYPHPEKQLANSNLPA